MPNTLAKTILVVDDDQFITIAYKAGLEHAGYTVLTAADGEDAIRILGQTQPDLILLDIIMPKMDGFEVLRALKSDKKLAHIPIIIFTNLGQDSDEKKAIEAGAVDFLIKANVSLKDILARLERHFGDTATAQ